MLKLEPELEAWYNSLSESDQTQFQADVIAYMEEQDKDNTRFAPYQFKPIEYVETFLGWRPWAKQTEAIEAYLLALRQLHEKDAFEQGEVYQDDLEYWQPAQVIKNTISIDAGHNVGKTKWAAGMVSHFFDCFAPSIVYCFAPSKEQIDDLLFKEIRKDRNDKNELRGRVLQGIPRINYKADHFVRGKATDNSNNTGTERAQGQHGKYLMFVLDEAEGIPGFVWDAVESMSSGGIAITLVLRNPRTTTCHAHKVRKRDDVAAFRISSLEHPNVLEDREVVPGSVRREYVLKRLKGCKEVDKHDPDNYTFELPWQPGVIYQPSQKMLWQVLGIASSASVDDTFCPVGRFEAAQDRPAYDGDDPKKARLGVDAARYGNDKGTVWVRHAGRIYRASEIVKSDGSQYYLDVKAECKRLKAQGVEDIQVRVDGGGGYGSTCIDNLNRDADLKEWFKTFEVFEVHNNGTPKDATEYADKITELYADACESLKALRLEDATSDLQEDLCERKFKYVIRSTGGNQYRMDLKQLVPKEQFRNQFGRSPDDGDGVVLAVARDSLFKSAAPSVDFINEIEYTYERPNRWR